MTDDDQLSLLDSVGESVPISEAESETGQQRPGSADKPEAVVAGSDDRPPEADARDPDGRGTLESGPPGSDDRGTLFYLTNRLNLNGILSSRLVAPRESYQKYYADLLEMCPGWVPLLTGPPAADLIDMVTAERGSGGPVLIEFPAEIGGLVHGEDAGTAYVPAVALFRAAAIHFRDQRSLREHRARLFSNVHAHNDLLRVSPDLFVGAGSAAAIAPPSDARSVDWQGIDRIRGALSGLLASCGSGEQLTLAAVALSGGAIADGHAAPIWLRWDRLRLSSDAAAEQVEMELDAVAFSKAYEVLGVTDATVNWSPRSVLASVEDALRPEDMPVADSDLISRNFERVREVIAVEREFEPFRTTNSALVTAKALLLVLLRPDLGDLLDWSDEETGADDATRLTAGALAGRLRGLARESVLHRSVVLDDLTASWAVGIASDDEDASLGAFEIRASSRHAELLIAGSTVRATPPPLADPIVVYETLPRAAQEPARVTVCRAMGWPVRTVVRAGADCSVEQDGEQVTLTTSGDVEVSVTCDEDVFADRLVNLHGSARSKAVRLLEALGSEQRSGHANPSRDLNAEQMS